ncbi:MAG: hypothetical protein RR821_05305 [Clostridia bacterium]
MQNNEHISVKSLMRMAPKCLAILLLLCIPFCGGMAEKSTQEIVPAETPNAFYEDSSAMRDISWEMNLQEVAQAEGVQAGKKTVVVKEDVTLYLNEVSKLTYTFEDELLVSRTFTLKNRKDYDSALYSVFMRYGAPFMLVKKDATWELMDMQISAVYQKKPTITFTVKRSKERES